MTDNREVAGRKDGAEARRVNDLAALLCDHRHSGFRQVDPRRRPCVECLGDVDVIHDALGHLYQTAPLRREELIDLARRTGLRLTVDA